MRDFGIYPEGITPDAWWGARAIISRSRKSGERLMELLPDRQNAEFVGGIADNRLIDWLNDDVLPDLRKQVKLSSFRSWQDMAHGFSHFGDYYFEASPKNSGGEYLYIGAWTVKPTEYMIICSVHADEPHKASEKLLSFSKSGFNSAEEALSAIPNAVQDESMKHAVSGDVFAEYWIYNKGECVGGKCDQPFHIDNDGTVITPREE